MNIKYFLHFFFLLFIFFLGFAVHALFFPTLLTRNITISTKRVLENKKAPVIEETNKAVTHVLFEEGEFDPPVVVIRNSYYLGIMNNSDKELMTLTSDTPLFRTPRGYGLSEEHMMQLYDKGEYTVSSLLHPDKVLRVIVK
jgi:hypothetical protein